MHEILIAIILLATSCAMFLSVESHDQNACKQFLFQLQRDQVTHDIKRDKG